MTTEERTAFWEAVEGGDNPLLSVMHDLVEKWECPQLLCLLETSNSYEDAEQAKNLTPNQRGLILGACAQVCSLSDQMHAEMEFLEANQ